MNIALVAEYLETHEGRDKFLRTLSYAAKLASGFPKSPENSEKWKRFGSQLSGCRVIMRLLDDIPTIHYAISYNWGKKEPDWLVRWTELLQILIELTFGPVEHICWAGGQKLISINVDAWDHVTTWFWILSLYLSLIKCLRRLRQLNKYKSYMTESNLNKGTAVETINTQQRNQWLICTRLLLDMTYAVSYLPEGTLWGGRFQTWQVGLLGTISSVLGLYQAFAKRLDSKKYS